MANGASAADACLFFNLQARRLGCLIPSYLRLDPLAHIAAPNSPHSRSEACSYPVAHTAATEPHNLTEAPAGAGGQCRQFASENEQNEFLPARDAWWLGLFALEDTELLPQEQDFEIFVMLASTTKPDEVEQERERLREKKEKHAGSRCRDHAQR